MLSLNGEMAVAHDGQSIDLDGTLAGNDIDVNLCVPIRSCEFRVGIAERHMQPRHLLILQQVAAQTGETGQRANSELSGAVPVRRREEVAAHILYHSRVFAAHPGDIPAFDGENNWLLQHTIFAGEEIAQHIAYQHAINSCRRGEDFAFGQVAPFPGFMIASMTGYPLPVLIE